VKPLPGFVLLGGLLLLAGRTASGQPDPVPVAEPSFESLNDALGAALWQDNNLWDDPIAAVAARIPLPPESKTSVDRSFRWYPPSNLRLLGARPYSVSLLGTVENSTRISIVFANKGDFGGLGLIHSQAAQATGSARTRLNNAGKDLIRELPGAIRADARAIEKLLTDLLGPAATQRNQIAGAASEPLQRWNWKGHAILLAVRDRDYAALRIVPTAVADSNETPDRVRDAALRTALKQRIERRANGDVILSDIPMVDQGPKGFCVPATMERTLRYLGIAADMYLLAMLGDTAAGGGTSVDAMVESVTGMVRSSGRRVEKFPSNLRITNIRRAIDDGLPILWSIHVAPALDESLTQRAIQRAATPTAEAWKPILKKWTKLAGRPVIQRQLGHICLIVGYNAETDELAISDSWGPAFRERWITIDEASVISADDLRIIDF